MTIHLEIRENVAGPGGTQINNVNFSTISTTDDIDRSCLRTLQYPDTLVIKNRLKVAKGKLLRESIDWILKDEKFDSWQGGRDTCLLWIKGGAGKGKTMISIGLIEWLSLLKNESTVVTYFFCQNADYELNTIEAIIKGLIRRFISQQKELIECLQRHWDPKHKRFNKDITSWRTLVYVIVDALDECQDQGMADLLKLIVRTGLDHPSKIKWLLTSRPLDSAERELLDGSDQVLVDLDLDSRQVSEVVKTYIASKTAELARRNAYGTTLHQEIRTELTKKAGDTFLWISLVCEGLENVHRDKVLTTIQQLPPGLHSLYHRAFSRIREDESVIKECMRLLKVMMLAYRPLNIEEVGSMTGLSEEWVTIKVLVNRCTPFVKINASKIEFVHQSARDYLAEKNGQSMLDSYECYGHSEIAMSCLSHLSQRLKVNLVDLPQPDSTRESAQRNELVASVDYAATFWGQHFEGSKQTTLMQNALTEQGEVCTFIRTKLLEWLECLSLLEKLPRAIEVLKILNVAADSKKYPFLSMLVQDATRFLLRHYPILATSPLQIYSSAIVFSPQTSAVRRNNLNKLPTWFRKLPQMEDSWASLVQTLAGHSWGVYSVAFSSDGKQIASGSWDNTIKLWGAITGDLQTMFIECHSHGVTAIAFSPDGKQIASGSWDNTIRLWDTITGDLQKTFQDQSGLVTAIEFLPDGKQVASGSTDRTINLWDVKTGDLQKTFNNISMGWIMAIAISPDGKQIALGSVDKTIKLCDAITGNLQKTLKDRTLTKVTAVAFSPDGKQIASVFQDQTIKLWEVTKASKLSRFLGSTGESHLNFRVCHEIKTRKRVNFLKFSMDGRRLITNIGLIKLESTAGRQSHEFEWLEDLWVGDEWVYCGAVPLLRLPSDYEPQCQDIRGDQVAIGCRNGRVLSFDIDRKAIL